MKRDAIRTFGTTLVLANALIAFLSLTNLFLVAAGAIAVSVPDADDLEYEYDVANRTLLVDTSFTVRNNGIYSVKHLDITSRLCTEDGYCLMRYDRQDLRVAAGEERTFPIHAVLDLTRLADPDLLRFLVEDGAFELRVKVRADYTMGLTKFRSDEVVRYDWDSPLEELRELLLTGNLSAAAEAVLGWAGPVVRGWLAAALVDAAMAEGQWRHQDLAGWAGLDYRLWLNETAGSGALDLVLTGELAGFEWHLNGTVPLVIVDGQVYLEEEVARLVV